MGSIGHGMDLPLELPRDSETTQDLLSRLNVLGRPESRDTILVGTLNQEDKMIGQGINTQRIQRWAIAVVRGPNAPAGSLRLTLHHASIDEAIRLLRTWELDGIPPSEDLDDVIGEIDREAAEDASQLGWGVSLPRSCGHSV
jgi:hypothetical protein